jgi:hypothetical protein
MAQTQEEKNLAQRLRSTLKQSGKVLRRTAAEERRSNPNFGPYLIVVEEVLESGTLEELAEGYDVTIRTTAAGLKAKA